MLTKSDISSIRKLLIPLETKQNSMEKTLLSHSKASKKEHNRLQNSINRLADDLGEDVFVLKEKMAGVESHLGFASIG